ncbi:MAG: tetratricopeptide repeat protein [Bacteroidetes bacterium]|nr:tetratricopeptide repeat protein [Bacteroidota bacterium]
MRKYPKYRLLQVAIAALCAITYLSAAQEKPLPPLLEMMNRPPRQSEPPSIPKKGLIPLEILTESLPKSAEQSSSVLPVTGTADLPQDEPAKRKLPTLREQLQIVEDQQNEQNNANEDLRKEIADIKRSIIDLRREVSNISADKNSGADRSGSHKSEYSSSETHSARELKKKSNNNVILPDGGDRKVSRAPTNSNIKPSSPVVRPGAVPSAESDVETKSAEQIPPPATSYSEAMNLISKKKYSDAIPFLQQALQADKSASAQSGCYYWLGESNFGLGRYDEAIKNFQKVGVLKTSTKLDDAQLMIAESYYRKGDVVSAKAAFQRLINVFPRSEYVARARKMLQTL